MSDDAREMHAIQAVNEDDNMQFGLDIKFLACGLSENDPDFTSMLRFLPLVMSQLQWLGEDLARKGTCVKNEVREASFTRTTEWELDGVEEIRGRIVES